MASAIRDTALVVIQLSGGNDCLDTVVPYTNGLYYDFRPTVKIAPEAVLPIDDAFGFHPSMGPIKRLWDEGKVAIINGIGYPHPDRSHFRSMDIWHTAEPEKIGTEGWLGRAIRALDPRGDNVLTGINFGRGLPRALGCRGVPVASVGNLETYGLFSDLQDKQSQQVALETFARMYGGAAGRDAVMSLLGQTGSEALQGADMLRTAPAQYTSTVAYADNPMAQNLKSMAQVLCADLGTRIYDTSGTFLGKWGVFGSGAGALNGPAGIAIDADDHVYIVDQHNHRVQKFTSAGTYLLQWGEAGTHDGQFNLPWGVAVDTQGAVYVADWRNDRLQKFTPDGQFVARFGESGQGEGQFQRPSSVAVDAAGYIYVADWGNERVQVLGPDGSFQLQLRGQATLSKWAQEYFAANPEEWQTRASSNLIPPLPSHLNTPYHISSQTEPYFWGPVSVTLDREQRLYVPETNRHRVQIYQKT